MNRLKRGDIVRLRREGSSDEWCPGVVDLASEGDPQSIGILLQGILRGDGGLIGGALPLLIDYEAQTITPLIGGPYELNVLDVALVPDFTPVVGRDFTPTSGNACSFVLLGPGGLSCQFSREPSESDIKEVRQYLESTGISLGDATENIGGDEEQERKAYKDWWN